MKRWIKVKEDIWGMSMELGKAKKKIDSLSDIILEHVCKCVLYRNKTNDYRHWIYDEIATWISYINDVTIKPANKKMKAKDYANHLFGGFGDSYADARLNLNLEYNRCRKAKEQYPEVEITHDMITDMVNISNQLTSEFSELLSSNNDLTKEEIGNRVRNILDCNYTR